MMSYWIEFKHSVLLMPKGFKTIANPKRILFKIAATKIIFATTDPEHCATHSYVHIYMHINLKENSK